MKKILSVLMALLMVLSLFSVVGLAANYEISDSELLLDIGETYPLKVVGADGKKIVWDQDNIDVVYVSPEGVVRGKKGGNATVTAKVSGQTLKCNVTVKKGLDRTNFKFHGGKGNIRDGKYSNFVDYKADHSNGFVFEKSTGCFSQDSYSAGAMREDTSLGIPNGFNNLIGLGANAKQIEGKYGAAYGMPVHSNDEYNRFFEKSNYPVMKKSYKYYQTGSEYCQTFYFNDNNEVCLIVWH